jgi:type I thyroxine 5'-deiodinase
LYQQYKDRAAFYVVYILEAHSIDVWQMQQNVRQGVILSSPRDFGERSEVAGSCVRKLGIQIPALVDNFDNSTEAAYTGWPDRLYVIDRGGNVAYKSEPGPFGFRPAEMAAVLRAMAGPGQGSGAPAAALGPHRTAEASTPSRPAAWARSSSVAAFSGMPFRR